MMWRIRGNLAPPEVIRDGRRGTLGDLVELEPVLGLHEPVALVLEEQVLVVDALRLHRVDDLLGLRLLHARVVRALRDQHRDLDLVDLRQRRARPEELLLGLEVADALLDHREHAAPSTAGSSRSTSSGSRARTIETAQRYRSGVNVAPASAAYPPYDPP